MFLDSCDAGYCNIWQLMLVPASRFVHSIESFSFDVEKKPNCLIGYNSWTTSCSDRDCGSINPTQFPSYQRVNNYTTFIYMFNQTPVLNIVCCNKCTLNSHIRTRCMDCRPETLSIPDDATYGRLSDGHQTPLSGQNHLQ